MLILQSKYETTTVCTCFDSRKNFALVLLAGGHAQRGGEGPVKHCQPHVGGNVDVGSLHLVVGDGKEVIVVPQRVGLWPVSIYVDDDKADVVQNAVLDALPLLSCPLHRLGGQHDA